MLCPFSYFWVQIAAQNAWKSLRWPWNVLILNTLMNYNILYTSRTIQSMFWTSMTMETSKILHFQNCTSNCSNSLRVLELSQTSSNPCSQKIELDNPGLCWSMVHVSPWCLAEYRKHAGLARTIYIRCIYGIFGRIITKYTVIYGAYIRFWPTLLTIWVPLKQEPIRACLCCLD